MRRRGWVGIAALAVGLVAVGPPQPQAAAQTTGAQVSGIVRTMVAPEFLQSGTAGQRRSVLGFSSTAPTGTGQALVIAADAATARAAVGLSPLAPATDGLLLGTTSSAIKRLDIASP